MRIRQRSGALVVAAFAVLFTRTPWLIRLSSGLMVRLLRSGLPMGPNVLLTVRGRRSGVDRSTPVAFWEDGRHGLLQAASADVAWVRNLRSAGEAAITRRGRVRRYSARELDPLTAGEAMYELLAHLPLSSLVRAVVGPVNRPPVGVLRYFGIRVDTSANEYVTSAKRQPVFELQPR